MSHWFQILLIINFWQHWIEGDKEFKTMGMIRGGERDTNGYRLLVTIICLSTFEAQKQQQNFNCIMLSCDLLIIVWVGLKIEDKS